MKPKLGKWSLKDKNTWFVIGLVGALLLVIAMPADKKNHTTQKEETENAAKGGDAAADDRQRKDELSELEHRLEESLSLIDGAGKVRVMITWKDTGEKIVEKDMTKSTRTDSLGNQEENHSQSSVASRMSGDEIPYISNELLPRVEGVLVIAQGGGNSNVKQNILNAVMSLFPLEAHKITIVKMSMQEDDVP